MQRRQHLWRRLSKDLKPAKLHDIKTVVPFSELKTYLAKAEKHDFLGRIVVDLRPEA
ncbi:hypothetical protein NVR12_05400 [Staphylococcus pseudintermedius]|nr:hypothetical protein [Staphylococcus pseudintermedius]MDA3099533.1 hypothetical protein [Staphylococcus pseudintermedius]